MRVKPRQVQVRGDAAPKPHEREDDVLDPGLHVALPARVQLDRLLADEVEDHRDVVRAEAPERVLVGAQLAEVEPVRVEVADLAELARLDQLGERPHPGVVLEQVADHQHAPARGVEHRLGVCHRGRERLLDETVLARREHPPRKLRVRPHRRRQQHPVEPVVREQLVERARDSNAGK